MICCLIGGLIRYLLSDRWVDNSLLFYRSVGNAAFDLLLKTDDDCYIDVDKVLMKIDHKGLKRHNFWWGK